MILIKQPKPELITITPNAEKIIELIGRIAYKSEEKITEDSYKIFLKKLLNEKHLSVFEHASATFRLITSRDVTHQLVRHRIASYTQESQRYVNYGKKNCLTFVIPYFLEDLYNCDYIETKHDFFNSFDSHENVCIGCSNEKNCSKHPDLIMNCVDLRIDETSYLLKIKDRKTPQQSRCNLPNSTKTEICMTTNFREWLWVLNLRTHISAYPPIIKLMEGVADILVKECPIIFNKENYRRV